MGQRKPYVRGAKQFLAEMKAGEIRQHDGRFNWRNLQSVAARLERDLNFEVEYVFQSNKRVGQRIIRIR